MGFGLPATTNVISRQVEVPKWKDRVFPLAFVIDVSFKTNFNMGELVKGVRDTTEEGSEVPFEISDFIFILKH
jgi:hypothetical protein